MIWIPEVSRIAGGRDTVEMGPATQAFEIVLPVEPADLDQLGHVNNVTYLRWVQEAAVAHWTAVAPAADQAKDASQVLPITAQIRRVIQSRHRASSVYRVQNLTQLFAVASKTTNALTAVLLAVSLVVLLVSGIGIMNI